MPITVPSLGQIKRPPKLDASKIPADQQAAFGHIRRLLGSLMRYETEFRAALSLYEACQKELERLTTETFQPAMRGGKVDPQLLDTTTLRAQAKTLMQWQALAVRDGALAIYHFGSVVYALKASFPKCRALKVSHSQVRLAKSHFEGAFPYAEIIRTVIAHSADFIASETQREEHSVKGPHTASVGETVLEHKDSSHWQLTGWRILETYWVSYEGGVYGYKIDQANADRLTAIKDRIYDALADATIANPAE